MHEEKQLVYPAGDTGADGLYDACCCFGGGGTEPVSVVSATYDQSTRTCEVQFAINDTAEENVVIDVMSAIMEVLPSKSMPSNQIKIKVSVVNNSPNAFAYQNNGLKIGTNSYAGEAGMTAFVGYDGNRLPLPRIAAIDLNNAVMRTLFEQKLTEKDADKVLTLFTRLAEKGYTGEDALSRYFVDYYKKTDSTVQDWADLISKHRNDLIDAFAYSSTTNYFFVTKEWLDAAEKTEWNDFIYVLGTTETGYAIQFKWPDKNLAEFSYNVFYQDFLTVSFGDKVIEIHSKEHRDIGVGDYLNQTTEPYIGANSYLASIGDNGQLASGAKGEFQMTITLEGPGVGNMYAYYEFSGLFNLSLQFIRATTEVSVTKEWDDANDKDGIRPENVSVQLYADGKPSGEAVLLNKASNWSYTFEQLSMYSKGKEITYTVKEKAVDGYTSTVTGNAAEGFVITNRHEPKVELPKTGDSSHMMFWLTLMTLSLCGMAVVLCRVRKEN